jgi:hypothetical protein
MIRQQLPILLQRTINPRMVTRVSLDFAFANVQPATPKERRPLCALVIDAEEDFDWDRPLPSTEYSTECTRQLWQLQEIVGAYGIVPTFLLTYPVMQDRQSMIVLQRQLAEGKCDVGVQLHSWVTPPFGEEQAESLSFSGNLPPGLEEQKLLTLKALFIDRFGRTPTIFRSGRYGLGTSTAAMLERHGFRIDTSIAPRTTAARDGGPDYSEYDYQIFWFGERERLLEVPLCRSIVGWGQRLAPPAYRWVLETTATAPGLRRLRLPALLTRSRFAERLTLSPEGNDGWAMLRLVRRLRARGQSIFVLSFHSSSLAAGRNPYVRSRADLHRFYDRLSEVLHVMATRLGFGFIRLSDLEDHLEAATP